MITSGTAVASAAVTKASFIAIPPGPATVLLANAGTASPVYFGAGTNVTVANGFPIPSGLVAPVVVPVYTGSNNGTWSVITGGGTATVSWLISGASGGTGL